MSKVPPRKKTTHGRSGAKGKSSTFLTGERKQLLLALGVVVVLAGIPFGLGKYFEFNSPGPFDSGAYVYSAAHILSVKFVNHLVQIFIVDFDKSETSGTAAPGFGNNPAGLYRSIS